MSVATTANVQLMNDDGWAQQIAARLALDLHTLLGAKNRSVSLALSGGSTPEPVYSALAAMDLPWDCICILQVDERVVPMNDPRSNAAMIRRAMAPALERGARGLWMDSVLDDFAAAKAYARTIARWLPLDIVVLGMGDDGHTASLFPGDGLTGSTAYVVDVSSKGSREARLSLGPSVLLHADTTHLIARGASKAAALNRLYANDGTLEETPARLTCRSVVAGESKGGVSTLWVDVALDAAAKRLRH